MEIPFIVTLLFCVIVCYASAGDYKPVFSGQITTQKDSVEHTIANSLPYPSQSPSFASAEVYPYGKKVYTVGEKILSVNCSFITKDEMKSEVIQSMKKDLFLVLKNFRAAMGFGRAVAAPQVGYSYRFVALIYNGTETALYNPKIIDHSTETFTMWDDCLSFPDKMVCIRRYKSISVEFYDDNFNRVVWKNCSQDLSELLQHEIDHLNGVLALDRAEKPSVRDIRSAEAVSMNLDDIPEGIISRDDWLARKDFYNQFVDFHC